MARVLSTGSSLDFYHPKYDDIDDVRFELGLALICLKIFHRLAASINYTNTGTVIVAPIDA